MLCQIERGSSYSGLVVTDEPEEPNYPIPAMVTPPLARPELKRVKR